MRKLFFLMLFVFVYSMSASAQQQFSLTLPPISVQEAILVRPHRVHLIVARYFQNTHVGLDIGNLTPENKRQVFELLRREKIELTLGNIQTNSPRNAKYKIKLYTGYILGVMDTTVYIDAGTYIEMNNGSGRQQRSYKTLENKNINYIFLSKETYQEMRTRLRAIIEINECSALFS